MRLAQLLNKTVETVTHLNSVLYELPKNRTDGSALLCGTAGGCRQSPGAAPLPTRQLREGATLYWVENPLNNLFTLRWRFQTGTGHDLNLLMLDDWMEYGGCDTLDYQALKKALQKLGGSLSFNLDVQDFTVTLEGPEEALPELLTLLNQKMSLPTLSEKERTAVINSRKSEKKLISREPRMKQNILSEFVRMGDQSIYLNYPSIKEMKTFDSSTVQEGLQKVLRAASDLHYAGQRPLEEVADLLDQQLEVLDQRGALHKGPTAGNYHYRQPQKNRFGRH